jgi:hypothetical protein
VAVGFLVEGAERHPVLAARGYGRRAHRVSREREQVDGLGSVRGLMVEFGEPHQVVDAEVHALGVPGDLFIGLPALCGGTAQASWAKPWMEVSGVRSSCPASAAKRCSRDSENSFYCRA